MFLVLVSSLGVHFGASAAPESEKQANRSKRQIPDIQFPVPGEQSSTLIVGLAPGTGAIVEELYRIVRRVNEENPAFPIDLFVAVPQKFSRANSWVAAEGVEGEPEAAMEELTKRMRAEFGLGKEKPLPHLRWSLFPGSGSLWLQDLAEPIGVRRTDSGPWEPALLNLAADGEQDARDLVLALAKKFGAGMIRMRPGAPDGVSIVNDGDRGGNIEVTHEGRLYVGDTISKGLFDALKRYSGMTPLVLPTQWLAVGHVDEYTLFVPHKGRCGGSLVHADPLAALRLIAEGHPWSDPTAKDVRDSLTFFRSKAAKAGSAGWDLTDFDLAKAPRRLTGGRFRPSDVFVIANLAATREIREGVRILKQSSKCLDAIVALPMLFREQDEEAPAGRLVAVNPLTNAIVLGSHVVLPKGSFSEIAEKRVGALLGGKEKVHFVDAGALETLSGSLHCSSILMRFPQPEKARTPGVLQFDEVLK